MTIDSRLQFRITVLAAAELGMAVLVSILALLSYPQAWLVAAACGLAGAAAAAMLYLLRATRYAPVAVYANLTLCALVIAAADPLMGTLSGGTWVLFQTWPPVALLILRRPRATAIMAASSGLLLVVSALLQINGTIPTRLLAPPESLYYGLGTQILIMALLASAMVVIGGDERRAYAAAVAANQQTQAQLARVQELADDKERINTELAQSLADARASREQLREEQEQRQVLDSTLRRIAAPVMPVLDGVVVMPLIGVFDDARLRTLVQMLLQGVQQHRARVAVLDVTGIEAIDTQVARTILAAVSASKLLGVQTVIVGVQPEMAQTLVGIGVDLVSVVTKANLQEGVRHAARHVSGNGRA